MKDYIYKVIINEKYTFYSFADTSREAIKDGKKYYLENNIFTDNKISSVSTSVVVTTSKIINR